MTCEEALLLFPMRPEDLEASERASLEAHLQACPACRAEHQDVLSASARFAEEVAALGDISMTLERPSPAAVPRRRPLWPWAAAAAAVLLLGIKAFWPSQDLTLQAPSTQAGSEAPVGIPPSIIQGVCKAESGDLEGVVGHAVSVSLRRGGVLLAAGTTLELKAGALHLDSPGEALALRAGGALLSLEDASVTMELPGDIPPALSWLGSAYAADEPEIRIALWRGKAEVTLGGQRTLLQEGQGALIRGERLTLAPEAFRTAWRGSGGWEVLEGTPLSLRNTAWEFLKAPPPQGYVWEALVRKRLPTAELALRLPDGEGAGGKGIWEFPLGALLLPAERSWLRLRVEGRPGWCRATAGSNEIVSCPLARLGSSGYRAEGTGIGLRAWGGAVDVKGVRWKAAQ